MVRSAKPALISVSKEYNAKGFTDVPITAQRKVTYVFESVTSKDLNLPYAVAVDGVVSAAFADKPLRVSGNNGKFTVHVKQGQRVSLYLNSDAHPEFRQMPVYAVTAGARDMLIKIKEKTGKHTDPDTPIKAASTDAAVEAAGAHDSYSAPLTGDIWMKISHKYTAAEAEARMPATTSAAVKAAVMSIYAGLSKSSLEINEPASDAGAARTLKVVFADADNPKKNITHYDMLADGLPRAHPAGYEALFTSALRQGISSMHLSSCWRPMIGSIAHRAGLGLDVSILGGTKLNRQELRDPIKRKTGAGNDTDNVTDAEAKAFDAYEQALVAAKKAEAEKKAAETALTAAKKSGDAASTEAAQQRATAADNALKEAQKEVPTTRTAWNKEREAGEPAHTRQFRVALLKCVCVRQLFDPWFMNVNTKDSTEPEPNMQMTGNETLHAHHLHITVDDPKIL
jgi:hypothetical protein